MIELTSEQIDEMLLSDEDWHGLHDAFVSGSGIDRELSYDECKSIFKRLPERLINLAIEWGCRDTVFRDDVFELAESGEIQIN